MKKSNIILAFFCFFLWLDASAAQEECTDIAGNWEGSWSEISCDGRSYSGAWTGYVTNDCQFYGGDDWDIVSGKVDPSNKIVTADGISEDGCGFITVTGRFAGDYVSGQYSYSLGGNGTFTGTGGGEQIPKVFADVPSGHWAEDFIHAIYNAGITSGCSQNPLMYCPGSFVTRAQMSVFLLRGIYGGGFSPQPASGVFDDCPASYGTAGWIEEFFAEGITSGCSENPPLYCPDRAVNRAQMAVFLLRSMYGSGYSPPPAIGIFDDVPVTHWAAPWIEQLFEEGVTGGCSANPPLYCPNSVVTRAQMAVFITRAFGF